ncbi:Protein of unknown function [Gryllus bimaculatus]|nr:Protein of unknown function [Gryllus bimaculatus]
MAGWVERVKRAENGRVRLWTRRVGTGLSANGVGRAGWGWAGGVVVWWRRGVAGGWVGGAGRGGVRRVTPAVDMRGPLLPRAPLGALLPPLLLLLAATLGTTRARPHATDTQDVAAAPLTHSFYQPGAWRPVVRPAAADGVAFAPRSAAAQPPPPLVSSVASRDRTHLGASVVEAQAESAGTTRPHKAISNDTLRAVTDSATDTSSVTSASDNAKTVHTQPTNVKPIPSSRDKNGRSLGELSREATNDATPDGGNTQTRQSLTRQVVDAWPLVDSLVTNDDPKLAEPSAESHGEASLQAGRGHVMASAKGRVQSRRGVAARRLTSGPVFNRRDKPVELFRTPGNKTHFHRNDDAARRVNMRSTGEAPQSISTRLSRVSAGTVRVYTSPEEGAPRPEPNGENVQSVNSHSWGKSKDPQMSTVESGTAPPVGTSEDKQGTNINIFTGVLSSNGSGSGGKLSESPGLSANDRGAMSQESLDVTSYRGMGISNKSHNTDTASPELSREPESGSQIHTGLEDPSFKDPSKITTPIVSDSGTASEYNESLGLTENGNRTMSQKLVDPNFHETGAHKTNESHNESASSTPISISKSDPETTEIPADSFDENSFDRDSFVEGLFKDDSFKEFADYLFKELTSISNKSTGSISTKESERISEPITHTDSTERSSEPKENIETHRFESLSQPKILHGNHSNGSNIINANETLTNGVYSNIYVNIQTNSDRLHQALQSRDFPTSTTDLDSATRDVNNPVNSSNSYYSNHTSNYTDNRGSHIETREHSYETTLPSEKVQYRDKNMTYTKKDLPKRKNNEVNVTSGTLLSNVTVFDLEGNRINETGKIYELTNITLNDHNKSAPKLYTDKYTLLTGADNQTIAHFIDRSFAFQQVHQEPDFLTPLQKNNRSENETLHEKESAKNSRKETRDKGDEEGELRNSPLSRDDSYARYYKQREVPERYRHKVGTNQQMYPSTTEPVRTESIEAGVLPSPFLESQKYRNTMSRHSRQMIKNTKDSYSIGREYFINKPLPALAASRNENNDVANNNEPTDASTGLETPFTEVTIPSQLSPLSGESATDDLGDDVTEEPSSDGPTAQIIAPTPTPTPAPGRFPLPLPFQPSARALDRPATTAPPPSAFDYAVSRFPPEESEAEDPVALDDDYESAAGFRDFTDTSSSDVPSHRDKGGGDDDYHFDIPEGPFLHGRKGRVSFFENTRPTEAYSGKEDTSHEDSKQRTSDEYEEPTFLGDSRNDFDDVSVPEEATYYQAEGNQYSEEENAVLDLVPLILHYLSEDVKSQLTHRADPELETVRETVRDTATLVLQLIDSVRYSSRAHPFDSFAPPRNKRGKRETKFYRMTNDELMKKLKMFSENRSTERPTTTEAPPKLSSSTEALPAIKTMIDSSENRTFTRGKVDKISRPHTTQNTTGTTIFHHRLSSGITIGRLRDRIKNNRPSGNVNKGTIETFNNVGPQNRSNVSMQSLVSEKNQTNGIAPKDFVAVPVSTSKPKHSSQTAGITNLHSTDISKSSRMGVLGQLLRNKTLEGPLTIDRFTIDRPPRLQHQSLVASSLSQDSTKKSDRSSAEPTYYRFRIERPVDLSTTSPIITARPKPSLVASSSTSQSIEISDRSSAEPKYYRFRLERPLDRPISSTASPIITAPPNLRPEWDAEKRGKSIVDEAAWLRVATRDHPRVAIRRLADVLRLANSRTIAPFRHASIAVRKGQSAERAAARPEPKDEYHYVQSPEDKLELVKQFLASNLHDLTLPNTTVHAPKGQVKLIHLPSKLATLHTENKLWPGGASGVQSLDDLIMYHTYTDDADVRPRPPAVEVVGAARPPKGGYDHGARRPPPGSPSSSWWSPPPRIGRQARVPHPPPPPPPRHRSSSSAPATRTRAQQLVRPRTRAQQLVPAPSQFVPAPSNSYQRPDSTQHTRTQRQQRVPGADPVSPRPGEDSSSGNKPPCTNIYINSDITNTNNISKEGCTDVNIVLQSNITNHNNLDVPARRPGFGIQNQDPSPPTATATATGGTATSTGGGGGTSPTVTVTTTGGATGFTTYQLLTALYFKKLKFLKLIVLPLLAVKLAGLAMFALVSKMRKGGGAPAKEHNLTVVKVPGPTKHIHHTKYVHLPPPPAVHSHAGPHWARHAPPSDQHIQVDPGDVFDRQQSAEDYGRGEEEEEEEEGAAGNRRPYTHAHSSHDILWRPHRRKPKGAPPWFTPTVPSARRRRPPARGT